MEKGISAVPSLLVMTSVAGSHAFDCIQLPGRTEVRPGFFSLLLDDTIDDGIYSAVFLPSLGCVVIGNAPGGTVPFGSKTGTIDPEILNKVVHHVFGALQGELHVVLMAAHVVGVPFDDCCSARVVLHEVTNLGNFIEILGLDAGIT